MQRDPKSFARMLVCFLLSLILVGAAHLLITLIMSERIVWLAVFQLAAVGGLVAYLVAAFYERGFVYTLIVGLLVAVAIGFVTRFLASRPLQMLVVLGLEVVFAGFIILGDYLGRPRLALRTLLGILGGLLAGCLISGVAGASISTIGSFWLGISTNLKIILELGIVPPVALLLTRLLLGESQNIKAEEELK